MIVSCYPWILPASQAAFQAASSPCDDVLPNVLPRPWHIFGAHEECDAWRQTNETPHGSAASERGPQTVGERLDKEVKLAILRPCSFHCL